jgi:integrase
MADGSCGGERNPDRKRFGQCSQGGDRDANSGDSGGDEMANRRSRKTPVHRLHKASGQGYVRLNRKFRYTGKWGTQEAEDEADRLIAEYLANGRQLPERSLDSSFLLKDLVSEYLARHVERAYVKHGAPTGEQRNIKNVFRKLLPANGGLPIQLFSPGRLIRHRDLLIAKGLSHTTINKEIGVIKRMFRWAAEREIVDGSNSHAIQSVQPLRRGQAGVRVKPRVLPVPQEDIDAVLEVVPRQIAAMIRLQLLTGMRPGEVVQMRRRDLYQTQDWMEYRPARHKTEHYGKERVVPLGPKAREIVRAFTKLDPDAPMFSPVDVDREFREGQRSKRQTKEPPFQQRRRAAAAANPRRTLNPSYSTVTYGQVIRRVCERLEIPVWAPNRLRHNAGTWITKELGLEAARAALGHADPRSTLIYAEEDRQLARRAAERLG